MLSIIANFFVLILKSVFSIIFWFVKVFFKAFRFFLCALPITAVCFNLLLILNTLLMIFGIPSIPQLSEYQPLLLKDASMIIKLLGDLRQFWNSNIYVYHGSLPYYPLMFLTVLMFLPVMCILLCVSVFMVFGTTLFYAIIADAALYLILAIFGKGFASQFLGRYYKLFPKAGQKHYEKNYHRWLRKHHREFEESDDEEEYDDEYEDDSYEDDFYEDEYDEDYEPEYSNSRRQRKIDSFYDDYDEDYDDEDYDDDEYEDDEYEDENETHSEKPASSGNITSFNFFAGCSSRDSVDKKYKSLVKLYHPDNMDGDNAALQEINVQYTEAKKRCS